MKQVQDPAWIRHVVHARHGEERNPHAEQVEQRNPEPEDRHAREQQREEDGKAVEGLAKTGRRRGAHQEAHRNDDEQTCTGQNERVAGLVQQHGHHRHPHHERLAEIAVQRGPEPAAVLDEHRPVQAELLAQHGRALLGVEHREQRGRDVAWNEIENAENDERNAE